MRLVQPRAKSWPHGNLTQDSGAISYGSAATAVFQRPPEVPLVLRFCFSRSIFIHPPLPRRERGTTTLYLRDFSYFPFLYLFSPITHLLPRLSLILELSPPCITISKHAIQMCRSINSTEPVLQGTCTVVALTFACT